MKPINNSAPCLAELQELLFYADDTGELIWLKTSSAKAPAGSVAGSVHHSGYRFVSINGKRHLAHRLAWALFYGTWPQGMIDHANGNKDDNRITNLRHASPAENNRNQSVRKDNELGLKGVSFHKASGKYRAEIAVEGKRVWLGLFENSMEAHNAYCAAAEKHFGRFSRKN